VFQFLLVFKLYPIGYGPTPNKGKDILLEQEIVKGLACMQYALVPSQYPRNTQGMDLDSNLLLFSSGICANVLQPKTLK
jgi:hypothetical protein